jgi:FtsH-binding integral membrane protein
MRNSMTETIMCVAGAAIFSAYIVYDTHMIMKHLSAEEYIVGVINLYLDIINLFIKILRLLQALNSQEANNGKKDKRKK